MRFDAGLNYKLLPNKTLHPTATSIQFDFQASISPQMSLTFGRENSISLKMIPPSKKILIGCYLIAASLFARVFVAVIAWQTIGEVTAAMNSACGLPNANHVLDGIQGHPTLMYGLVAACVILFAAGIMFLLIGVYQNAKATEVAS